jgi:hypothetical protein
MELWSLMEHRSWVDWTQARGHLIDGLFTDIESVCRGLNEDVLYKSSIVSIEYANNGDKALITDSAGRMFGAYKSRVPMREDVPAKW